MQLTEIVHDYLEAHVHQGDLAIDATAGNGYDILKMAELVRPQGTAIGIDIQTAAIEATQERLVSANLLKLCTLIQADHATALKLLEAKYLNQAAAITFNLGYLPGSDKRIQTTPKSTLQALDASVPLLRSNNSALLVTAYRGHAGGLDESEHIANWMRSKEAAGFTIKCHEPTANRIPPILWVLEK